MKINANADEHLRLLDGKNQHMVERRLREFAKEANIGCPGPLDAPDKNIRRLPEDLKDLRKITIGRHRVYYTGNFSQCFYMAIHTKIFKRKGVDDDDDPVFQNLLRKVKSKGAVRELV